MSETPSAPVVVYTTGWCPFCTRAKSLLERRGIVYTEYRIDRDRTLRPRMEARAGRSSVPQIFIGDTHVGGCDELHALDARGELQALCEGETPARS